MAIWRRDDRLKTLAFMLAGCGCTMSFWAGGMRPDASILQMVLTFAGLSSSLAGVGIALEMGNRRRASIHSDSN
jgi:hypothetical protein